MKKGNSISTFQLIMIIVFSVIIGGVITVCLLKFSVDFKGLFSSTSGTIITKNDTQVYEKSSLAPAVDKVYDGVVTVENFQGGQVSGTGSGFVYKVDNKYGYILTNQHVVEDAHEVKIIFNYSTEEYTAKYLGGDAYLDLAVIRIDKENVKTFLEFGNSENTKIGDTIFTIGTPMGTDFKGSVSSGILSGKDRMVSVKINNSNQDDWVMKVLQIDAPINPGNSGGPLLDVNGQVIGICSMKLVDAQIEGMGFAIPVEYAKSHVEALEKGKEIEWPVIGITMINVTDASSLYRNGISVDKNIKKGVVVAGTVKESAAEKAGLQKGDVIIKIDDKEIKDIANLRFNLYQHSKGDTMKTTVIRKGNEKTFDIKL